MPSVSKILFNTSGGVETNRQIAFDLIKLVAIFLVLWGHAIMHFSNSEKADNIVYQLIYSFHMPLFITVSGFFAASSLNLSLGALLSKKFRQLIYPALSFGILFFAIEYFCYNKELSSGVGYLSQCFWFLKSCFICYLILYLSLKLMKNKMIPGVILAFLIGQIVPIFKVPWMMPFFILGFCMNQKSAFLNKNLLKISLISIILFIGVFLIYFNYPQTDLMNLKSEILSGNYAFIQDYLNFHILRLLTGIAGTLVVFCGIIALSKKIEGNYYVQSLSNAGRHTLGIYILQTILLETILSRSLDLTYIDSTIFSFIVTPVISAVILAVSLILLNVINRNKYLTLALWGK